MIYTGTKNGTDYGFYLEKDRLSDVVELTDAEHMALMDGQSEGKRIVFHADAKPTLEDPPEPTEAELAEQARNKRDGLISAIEWRVQRYQQQIELNVETNDSAEWYTAALTYIQALRDVPEQDGFPSAIIWPEIPE